MFAGTMWMPASQMGTQFILPLDVAHWTLVCTTSGTASFQNSMTDTGGSGALTITGGTTTGGYVYQGVGAAIGTCVIRPRFTQRIVCVCVCVCVYVCVCVCVCGGRRREVTARVFWFEHHNESPCAGVLSGRRFAVSCVCHLRFSRSFSHTHSYSLTTANQVHMHA
jgi:hypothetical protein